MPCMQFRFKQLLNTLDLEDRILATSSCIAFFSVFLPWLSGQQGGSDEIVSYSGFEYFTGYIGATIALCTLIVFLATILPAAGVQFITRRKHREYIKVILGVLAVILTLAALSVLINATYEFSRLNIRFGIYSTFAGSIVCAFYAFWKQQEFIKNAPQEVFHHPEATIQTEHRRESFISPPPPPPPPPLKPEEYKNVR